MSFYQSTVFVFAAVRGVLGLTHWVEIELVIDQDAAGEICFVYSLCARGEGERMSRLIGLVGEAGTGEVRIRRSGAGDLDRGLLDQRSAPEWKRWSFPLSVCDCLHVVCVTETNLVLEAGRGPLAGGWRGQCGGSSLRSRHWRKRTLVTQTGEA